MRFVSRWGHFVIQLRPAIQEAYATGMAKVIQEPIYIRFSPYLLSAEERQLAMDTWGGDWNGSYQQLDEATMVPPDYRIGVFDSDIQGNSENWDEDTKAWVEEQMTLYCERWPDAIKVPATLLDPPWPKYDEYTGTPTALLRKLVEEGHDVEIVLAYERAVGKREKYIAVMEDYLSDPEQQSALAVEEEVVA